MPKFSANLIKSFFLPTFFKSLFSLFYPDKCAACANIIDKNNIVLCPDCLVSLPQTNFHFHRNNIMEKLFWGKVNIEAAVAFYYFTKKGYVQNLVHNLKYKGFRQIAVCLGNEYGKILAQNEIFNNIDFIIPVPLHINKQKKRGFNQAEFFAIGLSQTMKIPYRTDILFRMKDSDSQTNKKLYERWLNVKDAFSLKNTCGCDNLHFLLVDDVITTGATIEESAKELLRIPGAKVSVAAIAFAGL